VKKTILIAPFDGPLAAALASEASAAGWSVALALVRGRSAAPIERPQGSPPEDGGDRARATTLDYEPRSYVSASSLVLSARNALGELDAAILIFDPASAKADFLAGKPGELSGLVEERCSGPLYLSRELVRRFESRKAGSILFLAPESPRDAALGPAAAMADGAFEGLAKGLFAASVGAPWSAYGIRDASGQPERTARYALELLEEAKAAKAGRWIRYTGKTGLFG
jgi:hypothetical protein